jgi:hypothetical protein
MLKGRGVAGRPNHYVGQLSEKATPVAKMPRTT